MTGGGAHLPAGDPDLVALVRRMTSERAGGSPFDGELWAALTGAELHLLGLPAAGGGPGGELPDLVAVVFECARAAAAVPIAENYLAQWIRVRAGAGVRPGLSLRVAPASLASVTWAGRADEILVLDEGPAARAVTSWTAGAEAIDLAGQPAVEVRIAAADLAGAAVLPVDRDALQALADLLRAAQLAGAVRGCFELSRRYASEREQFGARIDSFPAVQQHLVQLAQAAAISRVSVFRAAAAAGQGAAGRAAARAARLVCDRSARDAVRCAHQVHGAIGMTREYPLAGLTRRLHWWRLVDTGSPPPAPPGGFTSAVWLEPAAEVHR